MPTRFQRKIKGLSRIPRGSLILPELEKIIEREAVRFKCSKSLVVATALVFHFEKLGYRFKHGEKYYE